MKRKLQSTVHDYSAELGAGDWPSRPEITALRETKAILVGEPIRRESDRVPLPRYRNAVYASKSTARVRVTQIGVAVKLLAPSTCFSLVLH